MDSTDSSSSSNESSSSSEEGEKPKRPPSDPVEMAVSCGDDNDDEVDNREDHMEEEEEEEEEEEGASEDEEEEEEEADDDDDDDDDEDDDDEEEEKDDMEGSGEEEAEIEIPAGEGEDNAKMGSSGDSGGFGALMMAQLSKLQAQSGSSPKAMPSSASSIVNEGNLEGVDWAALLDVIMNELPAEGSLEGDGNGYIYNNRPKYVPQPIKMLTPAAVGYTPSANEEEQKKTGPARYVLIKRPPELQAARMELPVCGMEQEIVESISQNHVIVLCGETGSGKSTQVPQFLYEYGYAR